MEGRGNREIGTHIRNGLRYDIGIDVGAINTKVLLLKDGKDVVGKMVLPTTMEPDKLADKMLKLLVEKHKIQKII